MEDTKKKWSFYDDAIMSRFLDFLKEKGKDIESPEAEELFGEFLSSAGDDSYVYWESYWQSTADDWVNWVNHGGENASST